MKEQNKLIAEFMGYETHPNQDLAFKTNTTGNEKSTININTAKYDSSWDWLMPVVEKIESLELGNLKNLLPNDEHLNCVAGFEIQGTQCNVFIQATMRLVDNFIESWGDTKIDATYKAVIEFIKWYNQQNQAK